jgi:hypothetical protein
MALDARNRIDVTPFKPTNVPDGTTQEVNTGASDPVIVDARPLELRLAAWTEREGDSAVSLRGTVTGNVAADREGANGIGARGVTASDRGPDHGEWSELLRNERARTTGIGGDRILFAQYRGRRDQNLATDAPTGPLVGTGGATAAPRVPIDVARLERLNHTIQRYNVRRSALPADDVRAIQRQLQAATDAARRGDYAAMEQAFGQIGFPLPAPGSTAQPTQQAAMVAAMLGATRATRTRDGGWQTGAFRWGAHGDQSLNDVNSFAANAHMLNRLAGAGMTSASNPPTEAEALDFMRRVSRPNAAGVRPDAATVMTRASEVVDGSIIHYSSAGAQDPQYGANPNPRYFFRDHSGAPQVFDTAAQARQAAAQQHPPIRTITRLNARSPDEWSDVTSIGTRSGRYIGDCESKLYLQQRLLSEAGFTSLGSVDVQPPNGSIGHMLGAFRSPDGRVFVTSNETFREVTGTGRNGQVTQADLDAAIRDLTADVYHVKPNPSGVRDTSGFRFSAARTDPNGGTGAPVTSIRRASENGMMRRTEPLL